MPNSQVLSDSTGPISSWEPEATFIFKEVQFHHSHHHYVSWLFKQLKKTDRVSKHIWKMVEYVAANICRHKAAGIQYYGQQCSISLQNGENCLHQWRKLSINRRTGVSVDWGAKLNKNTWFLTQYFYQHTQVKLRFQLSEGITVHVLVYMQGGKMIN